MNEQKLIPQKVIKLFNISYIKDFLHQNILLQFYCQQLMHLINQHCLFQLKFSLNFKVSII